MDYEELQFPLEDEDRLRMLVQQSLEAVDRGPGGPITYAEFTPLFIDELRRREVEIIPPYDGPVWAGKEDFRLSADHHFGRSPGQLHVLMARWFPEGGWLLARRGLVRHGSLPVPDDVVMTEAKGMLKAMQLRAEKDGPGW